MFSKIRNLVFQEYVYSEPFLMQDEVASAHYYQWKKNTKTNQGVLIKIKGQSNCGVDSYFGEYKGLLFNESIWIKNN